MSEGTCRRVVLLAVLVLIGLAVVVVVTDPVPLVRETGAP